MNIKDLRTEIALAALLFAGQAAAAEPAPIEVNRLLDVPIEKAWASWTTMDGLERFFAREAIVEARVDGEYSVLFFPDNPPGSRGAENMRIVAIEPPNRLMFTWNSPTFFAPTREQRAIVEIFLQPAGPGRTQLTLRHFAFGRGGQWAGIRKYFDGAWPVVLDRLAYSYANGPIDWDDVPAHLLYDGRPDNGE